MRKSVRIFPDLVQKFHRATNLGQRYVSFLSMKTRQNGSKLVQPSSSLISTHSRHHHIPLFPIKPHSAGFPKVQPYLKTSPLFDIYHTTRSKKRKTRKKKSYRVKREEEIRFKSRKFEVKSVLNSVIVEIIPDRTACEHF